MKIKRVWIIVEPGKRTSTIEPPIDENWTDLKKLQWNAAVVEHDAGLPEGVITILAYPRHFIINLETHKFSSSIVGDNYKHALTLLSGVAEGLLLSRHL